MKKVIVIGGGAAGLTAGVALASKGIRVTLFESRPFLGGRFYSFNEPVTGDIVDNGQHLLAGFYYNTFKLLTALRTAHLVGLQKNLSIEFLEKGSKSYRFSCPPLPMPLGLLWALFKYPKFPGKDLFNLVVKGGRMRVPLDGNVTAADWLAIMGQSKDSIYSFFRPLALATLNAELDRVSARLMQSMLEVIFSAKAGNAVLAFPKAALSQLLAGPAGSFISEKGGEIHLGTPIKEICLRNGLAQGVIDTNGQEYSADAYICALPPEGLSGILPKGSIHHLDKWKCSPIVGVNLWFDRPVADKMMVGFLDGRFHWCFDKSRMIGTTGKYPYLSLIISAANEEIDQPKEELIDSAVSETRAYLKGAAGARLIHAQVIKERKATVLITPEMFGLRPKARTGWPNLFLAGDWIDTGLPATVESAVKSGFTAADLASSLSPGGRGLG